MSKTLKLTHAMLVYQYGIANVFRVDHVDLFNATGAPRNAVRLTQSDFTFCVAFARGLGAAGVIVRTASCNVAGDCANAQWTEGVDGTPYRDTARLVSCN